MDKLFQQRCFHHPEREAAVRCPECRRYHCRECVVEHEERVLCASCLRKITSTAPAHKVQWAQLLGWVLVVTGFFAGWCCFYLAGRTLISIPSSFHDGTVWSRITEGE